MKILKLLYNYITCKFFGSEIDELAKLRLRDLAIDQYIEEQFDLSEVGRGEMRFLGVHIIKVMAAAFKDLLADAENYVTFDVSTGGETINCTIVRPNGMTPHQKAEMYKNKYEDLLTKTGEKE